MFYTESWETDKKEHWKEEGVVCQRDKLETPNPDFAVLGGKTLRREQCFRAGRVGTDSAELDSLTKRLAAGQTNNEDEITMPRFLVIAEAVFGRRNDGRKECYY